jgi:hypothetical protein
VPDLYEVLLVENGQRWHAGWVVDDDSETDVLLREHDKVLLFRSRAGLEEHAHRHGRVLQDDLPDEIDLDLGGWLSRGMPLPPSAEVSELWHLLYDDPVAGHALAGEELGEAYDDLVEDEPDWFAVHGPRARAALTDAVQRLLGTCTRA